MKCSGGWEGRGKVFSMCMGRQMDGNWSSPLIDPIRLFRFPRLKIVVSRWWASRARWKCRVFIYRQSMAHCGDGLWRVHSALLAPNEVVIPLGLFSGKSKEDMGYGR